MTREKAAMAARLLEKIVDFEQFMEEVTIMAGETEMSEVTRENIYKVLNAEMTQLNKMLEDL